MYFPVFSQTREEGWEEYIGSGYTTYKAEQDPHCPLAQIRQFNEAQREKYQAKKDLKKIKVREGWKVGR